MKKITLLVLFICLTAAAQTQKEKVWNLLLANKREDARKLYDKEFQKKKDADAELLILDALIDRERGRMLYDTQFLASLSKLPESTHLMQAIWYYPFGAGNVKGEGYDDLSYEKADYIAGVAAWQNELQVLYNKAIVDRRRLNYEGFSQNIAKLGAIDKWQFCGVFENLNGSGLETAYEPETYAKNDKTFNANSNGIVNWYNPQVPQAEGVHFYLNEAEYGNGIIYAQTFINSPDARNVVLCFAGSSGLKIFVNDTEIYVNDKMEEAGVNAYTITFNLKKGMNRLLIKSSVNGGNDYFFAALRDASLNKMADLQYFDTYQAYTAGTAEELAAVEVAPAFETYLINKCKAEPNNPLYPILLFEAYINNHKDELAYDAIEPLALKYPESSLINHCLLVYYNHTDNETKYEEISKNLHLKDEDYYFCIIDKFNDKNFLTESNISEIEKYRDKAKKMVSPLYALLYEYIIAMRNSDIDHSFTKIDEILAASYHNETYTQLFSTLYASIKNDKDKTVAMLEGIVSKRDNADAYSSLIRYYNMMNRKDDVKKLVEGRIQHYPYFNFGYDSAIDIANNENNYEQTLKYTDAGLKNFPYSFRLMEEKGRAYNSLKNTAEAQKYFTESLKYNTGNSALRKTLYAISKTPDEIEQVATKDVYAVIKQRRGKAMPCDYGVNMLLDEYIINVLPEGGRKAKINYVYEITAENGIEELKEYEIDGNNLNVIKAEIVKPDGSVQPGEENYGGVVFTGLKVGDVVHVEYETTDNGYGRFYRDFNFNYHFTGVYPSRQTTFGIIYPDGVTFDYKVTNGDVKPEKSKVNGRNYMKWECKDLQAIPLYEDYSPQYNDMVCKVYVSTIKSWGEISNWYADMVQKNLKMDNISTRTYNEIFPKGTQDLKEEEIAYSIYKYIEENITYSSLDFRQSGYVPQKPSKTIITKLGDCKDVSTLFVAMAKQAGLKANLVLVQTNDNGRTPALPSITFNHCIVRVFIDGKEHYLEMTDKYLPFKALPMSLYKANALNISFDKAENEKGSLISIPFTNALQNTTATSTVVTITDSQKKFETTNTANGAVKSYYNELFSDSVTPDVRKKEFEEDLNSRLSTAIVYEDSKLVSNERFGSEIKYQTKFSISEKLKSVGSLKIIEVPFIDRVYTKNIIAAEKRNYDIDYPSYESVSNYKSEVLLNIEEGKKFIEIPENQILSFKGHQYSLTYELVTPNSLKVTRVVTTPWDNVLVADYAKYKEYVTNVLAAEEQVIGFK